MTTAFHDVRFPFALALGASGGPMRRTEIVSLVSGHEERNSPWAHSRRRWNAAPGIKSRGDLETLIAFFEARHGQLHGFRFRDPVDHASGSPVSETDQPLGTGDGATAGFQLIKRYADGAGSYDRPIRKPVAGSVMIAEDGSSLTESVDFSVDAATGEVGFTTPPAAGSILTAGFEFDVPVRFDTDRLAISLDAIEAGEVADLPIVEIKA
ncbi:phage distal tail protein, Rcc01695 family [Hyphobacterium sp.]|uniref:phage distal tail protein, Rcc01695 family n=1 Tax=Hyphobacterium sp. TaxID=2004662 RepID=UPI003BA8E9DC